MPCDNCGKDITGRFINVNGGALLQDEHDPDSAGMDTRIDEFLSINTHDDDNELYTTVDVVSFDKDSTGQFEWYFCNKKCLKGFFNNILNSVKDIE